MSRKRFKDLRTIAVCITAEQEKALASAAEAESASISHIVRRAIDSYFSLRANVTERDQKKM